jgi:hypothetical protein
MGSRTMFSQHLWRCISPSLTNWKSSPVLFLYRLRGAFWLYLTLQFNWKLKLHEVPEQDFPTVIFRALSEWWVMRDTNFVHHFYFVGMVESILPHFWKGQLSTPSKFEMSMKWLDNFPCQMPAICLGNYCLVSSDPGGPLNFTISWRCFCRFYVLPWS